MDEKETNTINISGTALTAGNSITFNPDQTQWVSTLGYTLSPSFGELIDLKSLIVDKKIRLKSILREKQYDVFNVKKIKSKKNDIELECTQEIDTEGLDVLNSKSQLINEMVNTSRNNNFKINAIRHSKLSNSWIASSGTGIGTTIITASGTGIGTTIMHNGIFDINRLTSISTNFSNTYFVCNDSNTICKT